MVAPACRYAVGARVQRGRAERAGAGRRRPARAPTWPVGGHRFLPPTAVQLDPDSCFAIGPLAFMHATQYVKPRVALIGCALSADSMIFNALSSVITYNLVNYKFQRFNTYEV